jgi:hypothetical protein
MAFRLERGADRRWRCAAVELDGLHGGAPTHGQEHGRERDAHARVPAQSRAART